MDEKNKGVVIGASIITLGCALVAVAILMAPQPSPSNVTMGGDTNTNPAPVVVSGQGETQQIEFGGTTHHDSLDLANDLTVGDDVTVTGDTTITGASYFTGTVNSVLTSSTSLIVGQGRTIDGIFSTSTWIDFPAMAAGACTPTTTVALTGAGDGDVVKISSFNAFKNAATTTEPEAYVQSSGVVAVRLCNRDKNVAVSDPAVGRFNIGVVSY